MALMEWYSCSILTPDHDDGTGIFVEWPDEGHKTVVYWCKERQRWEDAEAQVQDLEEALFLDYI